MKKMLLCFWGKPKVGTFIQNAPFIVWDKYSIEETNVDIEKVYNQYLKMFPDCEIDVLWCTWSHVNFDDHKIPVKYKVPIEEPSDWESYLNSIDFPYVAQIKGHPIYHLHRPGIYTQFFTQFSIINYIKEHNLNYDSIFMSRTDIFHIPKEDFVFDFSKDVMYIPEIYWGSRGIGVNDHVVIGNFDTVVNNLYFEKFSDLMDIIGNSYNPEHAKQQVFLRDGKEIKDTYVEYPCDLYSRYPVPIT